MILAEYGLWVEDLDEIAISQLTISFIRRKQFESKILLGTLGQALSDKDKISSEAMLGKMS